MFPDPCGDAFENAVIAGIDPLLVVPDHFVLARGGTSDLPPAETTFSATVGPTTEAAAAALPDGTIRLARVGDVRLRGGTVEWRPERTRYGTMNKQQVNVMESGSTVFGE